MAKQTVTKQNTFKLDVEKQRLEDKIKLQKRLINCWIGIVICLATYYWAIHYVKP